MVKSLGSRNTGTDCMTNILMRSSLIILIHRLSINRASTLQSRISRILHVVKSRERIRLESCTGSSGAQENNTIKIYWKNLITNCPVIVDDAKRSTISYGPKKAKLQGATAKQYGSYVPTFVPQSRPPPILDHHRDLTLCVNLFCVQGHTFFPYHLEKVTILYHGICL